MTELPKEINPAETLHWMMQLIANGYTAREAREVVDDAIERYKEDGNE
jgi:hypothetical protein